MKCSKCKNEIDKNFHYCGKCGNDIFRQRKNRKIVLIIISTLIVCVLTILLVTLIKYHISHPRIDGFNCYVTEKNTINILSYDRSDTTVVIPNRLDGKRVTYIDNFAFEGNIDVQYVKMADSVEMMGSGVFKDCSSLVSVKLSNKLEDLSLDTFYGCYSLENITMSEELYDYQKPRLCSGKFKSFYDGEMVDGMLKDCPYVRVNGNSIPVDSEEDENVALVDPETGEVEY